MIVKRILDLKQKADQTFVMVSVEALFMRKRLSRVIPVILLCMMVATLILPALSAADTSDAAKPILDETKTQWNASGGLLIAALALILGVIGLVWSKNWQGLVIGLIAGVLVGSVFDLAGCSVNLGKKIGTEMGQ